MPLLPFFRRTFKKKKNFLYVLDNEGLSHLDKELSENDTFALDTEFDWRTTYFPKLSLIQISVKKHLFLIDCLKVNPENVLKKYLENKNILKIFHSVRSDTTVLSKCLRCSTNNVFDIQVADKILYKGEILSYGKIVKKFFNINLEKAETNSNWLKRPLTDNQINYALDDVDFLLEIFSFQRKMLIRSGKLQQVLKESENEALLGNQSLKILRLKKKEKKFSKRKKEIFIWREEIAEEEDIPPSFIFKDKFIQKLSRIDLKDSLARNQIMTIIGDTELTNRFINKFL